MRLLCGVRDPLLVVLKATAEFGTGCSIVKMQQIKIPSSFTPVL